MRRIWKQLIVVLILNSIGWLGGCYQDGYVQSRSEVNPLVVHVDGVMQPLIKKLAEMYEAETGQAVELNVADSEALLGQIEKTKAGDLFVCHDPFMDSLMLKDQMGVDGWTVSQLLPCLMVKKGNPRNIRDFRDLRRADVELCLPADSHSLLGRMVPTIFEKGGIDFTELSRKKNIHRYTSSSGVIELLEVGKADVAMVWMAVAKGDTETADMVRIDDDYLPEPGIDAVTNASGREQPLMPVPVTISTLKCTTQLAKAQDFAQFLISDRVKQLYIDYGYELDVQKNYQDGQFL